MYWNRETFLGGFYDLWLIETWDVLKFKSIEEKRRKISRLIETWDVLKLLSFTLALLSSGGLIETWDVLK